MIPARSDSGGVWQKPWGHGLAQGEFAVNRGMSEIGADPLSRPPRRPTQSRSLSGDYLLTPRKICIQYNNETIKQIDVSLLRALTAGSLTAPLASSDSQGQIGLSMIHTEQLSKSFSLRRNETPLRAVQELTLDVNEGEVFGFLGPNGAGKTTTVRMLTALIKPTAAAQPSEITARQG